MLEDLVDEVPDNLLDDDEYFARHPEDEEEGENGDGNDDEDSDSDDEHDDGGNEGAESESNSEEAEIVEMAEPMEVEIENVVLEEPVEVASGEKESVAEIPKDISVQYVRRKRSKQVKEDVIVEPEEIDVLQIAQEAMAEAESMAQIVEEADAGVADPTIVDIPTTSSQFAENIEQESEKEAGSEETVQVEPIQSEAVEVESVPGNVPEVASQFEPVQTDNAPMIEALDDLDDIDFTESEDETEP
ncbi:hypothetical protein QVD17_12352 [Tagetes erecta]|uniref:Uncharacterized protein n=1 Tax=Tagetes erecta TaxID=13708 RepID=A0AAD8KZF4_TARER|nr:hypothetical protein QVD17_12352 [Tagetes erecta]